MVTWDSSNNDLTATWRDTGVASLKVLYWPYLKRLVMRITLRIGSSVYELKPRHPKVGAEG